jgi:hypothetical protein
MTKAQKKTFYKELEELLARLSIQIRHERGDFQGGLCTFEDQSYFILNKSHTIEQKLSVLKSDLKHIDLEDTFIRPALREYLEL